MKLDDGTTEATREDAEAFLAELNAADKAEDAQATADGVQEFIAADAKLTAAGVTAEADEIDEAWVHLSFPADTPGAPAFWGGVAGQIIAAGGHAVEVGVVRTRKDRALSHLAAISALLPDAG